jgi:hypothetical protein
LQGPALLGLIAIACLAGGSWMRWRIRQASSWPQIDANILICGATPPPAHWLRQKNRGWQPRLECVFQLEGRQWLTRRPLLFPGWFSWAEADAYSNRIGTRFGFNERIPGGWLGTCSEGVRLRYNPDNPAETVAEINGHWPANVLIFVGTSAIALALALIAQRRCQC